MNKTLTEKIEEILDHDIDCATNASEVCDEFAVLPCSCGRDDEIKALTTLFKEYAESLIPEERLNGVDYCGCDGVCLGYCNNRGFNSCREEILKRIKTK
jgi:hypothetical protein